MMIFEQLQESLTNNVLGPSANNRFKVIGYLQQSKSADEVAANLVQVFYKEGDFPKNSASLRGPVQHEMTFNIEMTVAAPARGDIAAIADPNANPQQLINALNNFSNSAKDAESKLNTLIRDVYQIIMDARNFDLGLSKGVISNRWIRNTSKDEPLPRGEYVILTAIMILTCRASETVTGDTGTPGEIMDISMLFGNEETDTSDSGVEVSTTAT